MKNEMEVAIAVPKKRPFERVYQFKIKLLGTDPPVWRRIQVPESYTFYDLHCAIQDAMGWQDCHLHGFDIKYKPLVNIPIPRSMSVIHIECPYADPEMGAEEPLYITTEVPIKEHFKNEKDKAIYVYDYGDGWEHEVVLERLLPKGPKAKYPLCVDGQLSCPPEDCGSIPGYYDCIEAIKNKDNSEGLLDWLDDWKPDGFDPKRVVFISPKTRFENSMA